MKLKRSQVKKIVFKEPQQGGNGGGNGKSPKPPKTNNTETWEDEDDITNQPPSGGGGSASEGEEGEEGDEEGTPGGGSGKSTPQENKGKGGGKGDEEELSPEEEEIRRIFDEKIQDQGTGFDQEGDGDLPTLIKPDTDDDRYSPEGDVEINEVLRGAEQIRQQEREKAERGGTNPNVAGERGGIKNVPVYTDWKKELERFITPTEKKIHTYMQPNRRLIGHGIVLPTQRPITEDKLDIVVAVDTSGSVTKPILDTFMNEIISILKKFKSIKFKLLFFTSSVYCEVDINTTKTPSKKVPQLVDKHTKKPVQYIKIKTLEEAENYLRNLHFYDSGGTSIESIKPYLSATGVKEVDGLLVFTDGDNNQPNITLPKIKAGNLLFLINKGGNTNIVRKYGKFKLVDIEHTRGK